MTNLVCKMKENICFITLYVGLTALFVVPTLSQEFLPYIQLGNTTGVTRNSLFGDDACSGAINIPVGFHFGDLRHTTAYVCSNGLFSFGNTWTSCCPTNLFTSTYPDRTVVAPFWADINVNTGGNIWYEIHTDATSPALLAQVNQFIQNQHKSNFAGTWMLVAEWNNVPRFGYHNPRNTFQGLVITDGFLSYTVFTYECGDINWGGGANIGFRGDADFFINHPNSGTGADSIDDCEGSATAINIVYQLQFISYIPLGSNPDVFPIPVTGDDNCSPAIDIPIGFPLGSVEHTTAYVCTNGLISFGNPETNFSNTALPASAGIEPVAAPFWDDINLNRGGSLSYEVHTDASSPALLSRVNQLIRNQQQNKFAGIWMLVAYWNDVLPFSGSSSIMNTFQAVVITSGFQSYAVFIYQCGDLNWGNTATIGFKADSDYFANHPSSQSAANSVDCQGSDSWSTVIYEMSMKYLPFLTLGNTTGVSRVFLPTLGNLDEGASSAISITNGFPFGDSIRTSVYVFTNGYFNFESISYDWTPALFPANDFQVAPFWSNVDANVAGSIFYEVHNSSTAPLNLVSEFIRQRQQIDFVGTWMLIAYWNGVAQYLGSSTTTNSYQGILITDGQQSYAVFLYNCNQMEWGASHAHVGFNSDDSFYRNHILGRSANVRNVACLNSPDTEWSFLIYQLHGNVLPFLELGSTSGVSPIRLTPTADSASDAIDIPGTGIPFGVNRQTFVHVIENGFLSFGRLYTSSAPSLFPGSNNDYIVAPFWADNSIVHGGQISYEVHVATGLLTQVSVYIRQLLQTDYIGTWMLVAEWVDVHEESGSPTTTNTYQGIVITDEIQSFALFTYKCGAMTWSGSDPATIGYNTDGSLFANYGQSGTSAAHEVACQSYPDAVWSNVVYSLIPPEVIPLEVELESVPNPVNILDAEGFNSAILTCTATATLPTGIQATKIFEWTKAAVGSASVPVTDNGDSVIITDSELTSTVSTSVLMIRENTAGTFIYTCRVTVVTFSEEDSRSITVRGPRSPVAPTNLQFDNETYTFVILEWTVPSLAYTPETYRVMYGTDATNLDQTSQIINGTRNLDLLNQIYSVELDGLVQETIYFWKVVASNSFTATDSSISTFETILVPLAVSIREEGVAIAGEEYSLICTTVEESEIHETPQIQWIGPDGAVVTNTSRITVGDTETVGTTTISSLVFDPLSVSHDGDYTCQAYVEFLHQARTSSHRVTVRTRDLASQIVSDPPGPDYEAGSSVELLCQFDSAEIFFEPVRYEWTSTCTGDCFVLGGTTAIITQPVLRSIDVGTHTCTGVDSVGNIGVATTNIFVYGVSISYSSVGVLPNNYLIISDVTGIVNLDCVSASASPNVGRWLDPSGVDITNSNTDPFDVVVGDSNDPGHLSITSGSSITLDSQGVYTCVLPDTVGQQTYLNVGIYTNGFNTPVTITSLGRSDGMNLIFSLTCTSTGSPATTVTWSKNGILLPTTSTTYSMTTALVNGESSLYENTLQVQRDPDSVTGEYSCSVSNVLGPVDERTIIIRALSCMAEETLVTFQVAATLNIVLYWPEIQMGQRASANCTCGNTTIANASRVCGGGESGAVWETPDDSACNFTATVRDICQLSSSSVDGASREQEADTGATLDVLEELTENTEEIGTAGISITTTILEDLSSDIIQEQNTTVIETFLTVVDNLLAVDPLELQESQQMFNTSARLLESVQAVAETLPVPENESQATIVLPSLAIAVQEIQASNFTFSAVLGSAFEEIIIENNDLVFDVHQNATASITIPASVLDFNTSIRIIRITSTVYVNDLLFLRREEGSQEVGSIIISASVSSNTSFEDLDPPVLLTFIKNPEIENITNTTCNFWDSTADSGFGSWSTDGCAVVAETEEDVVCECNHLTNFAILLDVSPRGNGTSSIPSGIRKTLEALSYIGAVTSIFFLILTISTYLSSKKLRSPEPSQILVNLCFGLLGIYVMYILAFHATAVSGLCILAGVSVQYFLLATFFLMAADAILIFNKLIFVFVKIRRYVIISVIISWSAPAIIAVATVVPDYNDYVGINFCRPYGIQFYIGLLVPFLAIYVFNWIVYVIIMGFLIHRYCKKAETMKQQKTHILQQFRNAIALSLLFGIGWALGLPATEGIDNAAVRTTFQVLFIIATAFQGLFIFLIQCLTGNNAVEAKKEWQRWFAISTCRPSHVRAYTVGQASVSTSKKMDGTGKVSVQTDTLMSSKVLPSSTVETSDVIERTAALEMDVMSKEKAVTSSTVETSDVIEHTAALEMDVISREKAVTEDSEIKAIVYARNVRLNY